MGVHAPGPAEAARTVVRRSPSLRVRTADAFDDVDLHGTDPAGSVVLVVPDAGALLDIGAGRTVQSVEVGGVYVAAGDADPGEDGTHVDPEDYALPVPDPVADGEAALLGHLIADHTGELDVLVRTLPPAVLAARAPGAADRAGPVRAGAAGRRAGRRHRSAAAVPGAGDLSARAAVPDARAARRRLRHRPAPDQEDRVNAFALLGRHTPAAYEQLADAGDQLRIARLVVDELSRPDPLVETSVLDLARAELARAERVYLDRRAALQL